MTYYDIKLSRQHSHATRVLKLTDHSFNVPVSQSARVRVEVPEGLFDLDSKDAFLQAILDSGNLPASPPDVDDAWDAWRLHLAREAYDFSAPAPLRVAQDSPAGLSLKLALTNHAFLYGDDVFAPYRVLEHWFCVIGNGLEWSAAGVLTGGSAERLASPQKHSKDLQGYAEGEFQNWDATPLLPVPVHLYPLSDTYSALFTIPEKVEESFLVAAAQFMEYVLRRPVWENYSRGPMELVASERKKEVWTTDEWRHIALADGMLYRSEVARCYSRLMLGPWRKRLEALGFEDKGFFPQDYRLPPRAVAFRSRFGI